MAKTIPQLTDATTVNAADELIIQQGGITKRATAEELAKGIDANVHQQTSVGWHTTDATPPKIWRFKDRVFIGDAADFTGNQASGTSYGNSWVMDEVATYYYLNATLAAAGTATTRSGAGPWTAGVVGVSKWMGVGAICVNDGGWPGYSVGRGLYAEGLHYNNNGYTVGIECQVGNMTGTTLPTANAYSMAGSAVNGLFIGAQSGVGYLIGTNAPGAAITTPTQPCGAAIDITGGAEFATYQKFVVGIVFRNTAIYRSAFGATPDVGTVASMAMKHQLNWVVNPAGDVGGFVRSDHTGASQASGLKLQNLGAEIVGADYERPICRFRDSLGDNAATVSVEGNGTTATIVTTAAHSLASGQSVFINGVVPSVFNGVHTVTVVDATTFTIPNSTNATATTQGIVIRRDRNHLTINNSRLTLSPAIAAEGADTNIDILISPKGTGVLRFGTHSATSDVAITGFITIKDAAGNSRKLAVIS